MKNLEDEYRKSQQEQVPQLWDRIEKNLPEKKKKTKIAYVSRILGICAAAAVVLLVVPNLWNLNRDNSYSNSASEQSAEKSETMKVIGCTEVDSIQIFTLEKADGSTLCVSLSEDIQIIPQIGKTYVFTVTKDNQNTEYLTVSRIEEIQN
ncbi:MAG TPA: hypothetical protein VJY54_02635 [Lachnospiraceae bacterium]|nr:hypothetical protein [Lachnospiraceae bacterium]